MYDAALQIHPALAAIFILSSILALVAYVLALTRNWWGPPQGDTPQGRREPFLLKGAIVGLVVVLLASGVWPQLLQVLQGGR